MTRRLLALLCLVAWPLVAAAQTPCGSSLAVAQGLYVRGAFADVESTLTPCLDAGQASPAERVRAYRLLALSALQQGQLVDAKLAALSLLNIDPGYQPDPALDPPSYADLIGAVRAQLDIRGEPEPNPTQSPEPPPDPAEAPPDSAETPPAETVPPPRAEPPPVVRAEPTERPPPPTPPPPRSQTEAPPRQAEAPPRTVTPPPREEPPPPPATAPLSRRGDIEVGLLVGTIGYTGDIGRTGSLADYNKTDGTRLGLQVGLATKPWLVLSASGEGSYFHRFPVQHATSQQPAIRVEAQVYTFSLDARLRSREASVFSPYLGVGGTLLVGVLQDDTRVAGGPSFAFGVDLSTSDQISLFAEALVTAAIPVDAFDDSLGPGGDFFSGIRVGVRGHFRN